MKVKLAEGRELYDPELDPPRLVPHDEPFEVPDNQFWRRRIRDGDVTLVDSGSAEPAGEATAPRPRRATTPPPDADPASGGFARG